MDWIRRNWPDVLIGVALIAVIAGIIVTLLGGGSVFDLARSPRAPASPEPSPAVTGPGVTEQPVSPLAATRLGADGGTPGEDAPGEDQAAAPGADVVIPVSPTAADAPADGEQVVEGPVVTPLDPQAATGTTLDTATGTTTDAVTDAGLDTATATTTDAATDTATDAATAEETALADAPQRAATATPVPAPSVALTTTTPAGAEQTGAPLTEEEPAVVDVGAPWRILIGTFRVRDNAERLAAEVRTEGHPVFIATQDDLNMVLVGPFEEEAQTRDLAQSFRDAGREAEVYRVRGATAAATTVPTEAAPVAEPVSTLEATETTTQLEPVPPEAAQAEAVQPEAAQPGAAQPGAVTTAQAPAAAGSRYMQVGAYRTTESAAPQRERLEAMGYEVTPVTTDTGLIRLLIGPFSPEEAATVRQRLDAQGIEHTPGPATLN